MNDATTARFIRAAALAEQLGVAPITIKRWADEGRLPAPYRLGPGVVCFAIDELEQWIAQRRT